MVLVAHCLHRRVDDAAEALCRFGSPDRGFYRVADERFSLNR